MQAAIDRLLQRVGNPMLRKQGYLALRPAKLVRVLVMGISAAALAILIAITWYRDPTSTAFLQVADWQGAGRMLFWSLLLIASTGLCLLATMASAYQMAYERSERLFEFERLSLVRAVQMLHASIIGPGAPYWLLAILLTPFIVAGAIVAEMPLSAFLLTALYSFLFVFLCILIGVHAGLSAKSPSGAQIQAVVAVIALFAVGGLGPLMSDVVDAGGRLFSAPWIMVDIFWHTLDPTLAAGLPFSNRFLVGFFGSEVSISRVAFLPIGATVAFLYIAALRRVTALHDAPGLSAAQSASVYIAWALFCVAIFVNDNWYAANDGAYGDSLLIFYEYLAIALLWFLTAQMPAQRAYIDWLGDNDPPRADYEIMMLPGKVVEDGAPPYLLLASGVGSVLLAFAMWRGLAAFPVVGDLAEANWTLLLDIPLAMLAAIAVFQVLATFLFLRQRIRRGANAGGLFAGVFGLWALGYVLDFGFFHLQGIPAGISPLALASTSFEEFSARAPMVLAGSVVAFFAMATWSFLSPKLRVIQLDD